MHTHHKRRTLFIRWLARWLLWIIAVPSVICIIWSIFIYNIPAKDFVGSPPQRYSVQRSPLDQTQHGWFLERMFKYWRTRSWVEAGPLLLFSPILHEFSGWDVHNIRDHGPTLPCTDQNSPQVIEQDSCHCVIGRITGGHYSDGDGDYNFFVTLSPEYQYLAKIRRRFSGLYNLDRVEIDPTEYSWPKLLLEIDEPIRKNFPILYDICDGDVVKVCGSWVFDRAHPHNELHPVTWLEMVKEGNCSTHTSSTAYIDYD